MGLDLEDRVGCIGDVSIPEVVVEKHLEWAKDLEEDVDDIENYLEWYEEEPLDWGWNLKEFLDRRLDRIDGCLVSKKEAEFFRRYYVSEVTPDEGDHVQGSWRFHDDDDSYVVMTFFCDRQGVHEDSYMLVYKE